MIRCFMIEPVGRARLSMRRYGGAQCGKRGFHNAEIPLFEVNEVLAPREGFDRPVFHHDGPQRPDDLGPECSDKWPTKCDACAYLFSDADTRQIFSVSIYRRIDNGELCTLRPAPVGAMWWLTWMERFWNPQLGSAPLCVMTPGGEWIIDAQASNCTIKDDNNQQRHHCWVAHGVPPNVTVDKNGVTCAAGAGSIACGSYHGFLQNGFLT